MRSNLAITLGATSQVLTHSIPQGPASAATFKAFRSTDGDDATPLFEGTATLDTVATTLTSTAGPTATDNQRVPLTSTAGIVVGRRYRISENAIREWVEVVEVGASHVRVRHPLHSSYTAAATFVGALVTAAVPDVWAATAANLSDHADPEPAYRLRWALELAGVGTVFVYTLFDLVRAENLPAVDIEDINARAPGLDDGLPVEYRVDQGRPLIAAAWRAVKLDIAAAGLDVDAIRNDDVMDELVILRALRLLAEGGWRPGSFDLASYIEVTRTNYESFYSRHVLGIAVAAAGTSGSVDAVTAAPVWSK